MISTSSSSYYYQYIVIVDLLLICDHYYLLLETVIIMHQTNNNDNLFIHSFVYVLLGTNNAKKSFSGKSSFSVCVFQPLYRGKSKTHLKLNSCSMLLKHSKLEDAIGNNGEVVNHESYTFVQTFTVPFKSTNTTHRYVLIRSYTLYVFQ